MKLTATKTIQACDVLVLGVSKSATALSQIGLETDKKLKKLISDFVLKEEGFSAKFGEDYLLNHLTGDIKKVLLIGLGKTDEINYSKMLELGSLVYKKCDKILNNNKVLIETIGAQDKNLDTKTLMNAFCQGFLASGYKFDKYKTKKTTSTIKTVGIVGDMKDVVEKSNILNDSLVFSKDLTNEQAQILTPSKMAEVATKLASECNLEIKVYGKKELEKMNFGAFLAVGQGSEQEPKLIHLKYVPKKPKKKIALIGKGITFDAGGLDLKTPASMLDMKDDMTGCADVLAVIKAISKLKPDVEVHAISALCENMPSGKAYKPSDILTAKNGKTIEVENTDAEGRLTLADALTYADEIGYDEIIDIATLTGACIVALGSRATGIMGTNQKMIDKMLDVAQKSGENLWQLPIRDDMMDNLKSEVADMKNTGGREAGTSTAAKFLSNFIKNKNWIHLDIAGSAFISKPYRELSRGATGVMIKTLINYICE